MTDVFDEVTTSQAKGDIFDEITPVVSPKAKRIAKGFKFFGKEPSPEAIEAIRRPTGLALRELTSGFVGLPGSLQQLLETVIRTKAPVQLPTPEKARQVFETLAGEKFEPVGRGEKMLGRGAGLLGSLLFPVGGQIQPARSALAALLGTGAEAITEQIGAPKAVQTAASIAATLAPFLTRRGPIPPTRAAEVAKREAIEVPAAAVAPKAPRVRLKIAKETAKVRKRAARFEKSVEQAKDRILETVTPVAKTEKEASNLSKAASDLFTSAEAKADLIKGPVPTSNIQEALNKNILKLERSPALSTEETSTLNFLRKIDKGLEVKNTTEGLMAFNKSLNKEINFLKPTSGDRALLDVKEALFKDIEAVGKRNPAFFKDWKKANAAFAEFKKFGKIRETLAPAFTEEGINFTKFEKLFTDVKKQKQLTSLLGKEQFNRLKDISKLAKRGSDTFKEIAKDPRLFRQLERVSNMGIIFSIIRGTPKAAIAFALEKPAIGLLRGYYGRVMTEPAISKHYLNLLKSIKIASKKGIVTTAKRVSDDIEKIKKDIKD